MTYFHDIHKRMIICDACEKQPKNALSIKNERRAVLIGYARSRGWYMCPVDQKNLGGEWYHFCPVCVEKAHDTKNIELLTKMSGEQYAKRVCA